MLDSESSFTPEDSEKALVELLRELDPVLRDAYSSEGHLLFPPLAPQYTTPDYTRLWNMSVITDANYSSRNDALQGLATFFLNATEPDERFEKAVEQLAEEEAEHGPVAQTIMFVSLTLLAGGLIKFFIKILSERLHFTLPYTVIIMAVSIIYVQYMYI